MELLLLRLNFVFFFIFSYFKNRIASQKLRSPADYDTMFLNPRKRLELCALCFLPEQLAS